VDAPYVARCCDKYAGVAQAASRASYHVSQVGKIFRNTPLELMQKLLNGESRSVNSLNRAATFARQVFVLFADSGLNF
jgi:hypothetical protein